MKNILPILFCLLVINVQAQSWLDTAAKLDKIMDRYNNQGPGAQLAVSRNGNIIYSSVRGLADLEHGVALNLTSKIECGSVSKQFTAAAILLLEQQGRLSLNDDIRKYIPELKDYGNIIRISHLLHHTSGLKDWGSVMTITGWPRGTRAYTNEDALQIIIRQKTLNNKPGDEYIYSNSNFTLLTIIVKRVSGMSHAEFTKKNIFEPAGMINTEWRDDYKRVVTNRAIAYSRAGKGYQTEMPNEDTYGHGGLLTTAGDLIRWTNFYASGRFGRPSLFAKQTETVLLNNGKLISYAAGLVVDSINGWSVINHSGATAGYRCHLEYLPQLNLVFVFISNTSAFDTSNTAGSIRNILVKNIAPAQPTAARPVYDTTISWKQFIPYLGAYKNKERGAGFSLYQKENGIYSVVNGGPMPVINTNTLAAGRGRIIFQSVNSVLMITANGDSVLYARTDTARNYEASLREYTGVYYSEETDSKMYCQMKNGKLIFTPRPETEFALNTVYKDGFTSAGNDVWFERDKQNKLTHFYVNISRARRIEFKKIE
jgi:CubicO group peptidase (beta-lactamase class C family)